MGAVVDERVRLGGLGEERLGATVEGDEAEGPEGLEFGTDGGDEGEDGLEGGQGRLERPTAGEPVYGFEGGEGTISQEGGTTQDVRKGLVRSCRGGGRTPPES